MSTGARTSYCSSPSYNTKDGDIHASMSLQAEEQMEKQKVNWGVKIGNIVFTVAMLTIVVTLAIRMLRWAFG